MHAGVPPLPPDVAALAETVAEVARASTSRHRITVDAPASAPAFVDPLRIEQVLTNLVDNAIKYSPAGGPVAIDISFDPTRGLRIAVTDRGIGIPPEQRPHVFDRFYQGSAEHKLGGMGLGLHISREIVRLHGGSIDAEFPAEGGTRVVVRLAATPEDEVRGC